MTTIQANIPDFLAKLAHEVAEKEQTSLDNIVSVALAAQVSAWQLRDDIATRAKRADFQAFDRIMARIPANPSMPGDER